VKYRPLGKTGVTISEIGFGCGDNAALMIDGDPAVRRSVVARAIEVGISYFDTSNNYGDGKSEANLGATLKEIGAKPFVATKVRLFPDALDDIAAGVRQMCTESLERLQMESVDLYYLQNRVGAERKPGAGNMMQLTVEDVLGPVWETMQRLKAEGRTQFVGICTTGSEPAAARQVIEALPWDVVQGEYSILQPTEIEKPEGFMGPDFGQTLSQAGSKGMGVVAYRALAAGALAQRPHTPTRPSPGRGSRHWEGNLERAQSLEWLKAEGDETLAGGAVRFALSYPHMSSVLLGFSRAEYTDQANAYSEAGPLSQEAIARIKDLYLTDFGRKPRP